jgi:hypothetical protein
MMYASRIATRQLGRSRKMTSRDLTIQDSPVKCDKATKNKAPLKSILLLFGCFVFGFNASKVLHELGHVIAYWTTGGTVEYIIIHPLSWSHCIPGSVSEYPNFTIWGGVVFGTIIGLMLVALVWRWRGPYVMLSFMTGVVACLHNGFYLIFSCLAESRGDAMSLIYGGTSKAVVIAAGLLIFGIGLILAGMCLRLIGIRSSDGVKSRILVLGGGLLPYLFATLLYQGLYNAEELRMWVTKGVSIIILLFLLAILSAIVQRRVSWLRYAEAKVVTWPSVVVANSGAFVILSILFILLIQYIPRTTTRYRLSYYDSRSNFAGVKLTKINNPIASSGKRYQREYVVFWNWDGREGKTDIPKLPYSAVICPETHQILILTFEGILVVAMDGKQLRWIFKEDGMRLYPIWAVSREGCKALVYGLDPNLRKYVLIALDTSNNRTTKFELSESPWEIIFVDNNTAVASVGEDLIRVEFAESGEHQFSVDPGAAKGCEVEAVYKGELVFHQPVDWTEDNADQHTIEFGDMKISFTDPVRFVLASKSYIWAIDTKGQVFRLNSDGSKLCVGTYAPETMIGRGTFDDSLWIAFLDGTVTMFGDSKQTTEIVLPKCTLAK